MRVLIQQSLLLIILLTFSSLYGEDGVRVIVLANSNQKESVALAKYYAESRNIPENDIILLPITEDEEIGWQDFESRICLPLMVQLEEKGYVQGSGIREFSDYVSRGQRELPPRLLLTHKIDYVVIVKGIPLKIKADSRQHKRDGIFLSKQFSYSNASLDNELSLLFLTKNYQKGWVDNPFFNTMDPPSIYRKTYLKVSRIDGPDFSVCRKLIRNTLLAEKKGLIGRAYIDRGEDTHLGEAWLKKTGELLRQSGYDISENTEEGLIPLDARFDMPVFYFGWYGYNAHGLWQKDSVVFPPGSIFLHIHSFSGTTLRSGEKNWVGPMVSAGVTATVGNVNEPYLELTHHPHLLVEGLLKGLRWGDAVYYSLPALSWQSFSLGDPLYEPFKVSLEEQLSDGWESDYNGQYLAIRYMNQLVEKGLIYEAVEWGANHISKNGGRVVSYRVAELCKLIRDPEQLAFALKMFITTKPTGRIQDKLLIRDAVKLLEDVDHIGILNDVKIELADLFEKGLQ